MSGPAARPVERLKPESTEDGHTPSMPLWWFSSPVRRHTAGTGPLGTTARGTAACGPGLGQVVLVAHLGGNSGDRTRS